MFGHYAVLGIPQTATLEEIHSAYRQLAMMHHPDRNPDDTVGATTRFQKIQQAYEVLSDSFERHQHDATQNTTFPSEVPHASSEHHYPRPDNTASSTTRYTRDYFVCMIALLKHICGGSQAHYECCGRVGVECRLRELQEQLEIFEEDLWRFEWEARNEREAADEVRREAAQDRETRRQQARWRREGSVTMEQKFATCLHSEFCIELGIRNDARCDACGTKRNMKAFICPHCARYLCQLCVARFTNIRARSM